MNIDESIDNRIVSFRSASSLERYVCECGEEAEIRWVISIFIKNIYFNKQKKKRFMNKKEDVLNDF